MERWDRETSDERMIFAPGLLHADSEISTAFIFTYCSIVNIV
jgi:hypothetical protein